ncbi:hypothetical protein CTI14_00230 [Methylobacterium radiotolerans]|nr:hypothetical protein CTI14_00230 [Methylobacterium radiotolerans]
MIASQPRGSSWGWVLRLIGIRACRMNLRALARPVGLLLAAWCLLGSDDASSAADPQPVIVMRAPLQGEGSPQIDGGARQDRADWPATLKYGVPGASFSCTATLVGERVVVTAAHCLPGGMASAIELAPGKTVRLTCQHHPDYEAATLSADLALCLTGEAIQPEPAFGFERLDIDLSHLRTQSKLFLLGYGCRDVDRPDDPDRVGQLYGGSATIDRLPFEAGGHIVTRGPHDVVICPGDSGGAAYRVSFTDGSPRIGDPRAIVGINSGYVAAERMSAIAAFTPDVAEFVRRWAAGHGVNICGVHPEARNCR